jgi:hypothetical protein
MGGIQMCNKKLKLFISYCHKDNSEDKEHIVNFKTHISPLRDNGLIEDWYDREIIGGEDYQNRIDNNLEDADIICLFVSANFLGSASCKKEKDKAIELMLNKGVIVVPIILSKCGWLDCPDISKLLAFPTDGQEVTSFSDKDDAWHDIYLGLKKVIDKRLLLKNLRIKDNFEVFLQNTEMLVGAHSNKKYVCLSDIFVCPDLEHYDSTREYDSTINATDLLNHMLDYKNIAVAGEDQSGRTALCKVIIKELLSKNYIPIYIEDGSENFKGLLSNKIMQSLRNQFDGIDLKNLYELEDRFVIIVDDFHRAKNKHKLLDQILSYERSVIVVDDIFCLNIQDEELLVEFDYFKIRELKPSLRYELIRKWVMLTDRADSQNEVYKEIDEKTALLNDTLGRVFNKYIMPAYPFFVVSALVTYETLMPLDHDITSQGYCYQALIYYYLRKQGVSNDDIDIYLNFLTEVAFNIYVNKKEYLNIEEFDKFLKYYMNKYNLPMAKEKLLNNLRQIFSADSFLNYSFKYLYLFYFFVAKFLSECVWQVEIT